MQSECGQKKDCSNINYINVIPLGLVLDADKLFNNNINSANTNTGSVTVTEAERSANLWWYLNNQAVDNPC